MRLKLLVASLLVFGCSQAIAGIVIEANNEMFLAGDHGLPNPIHEHSDPNDTSPHAHNSQESVVSTLLSSGQVAVVYESYHGDSDEGDDGEDQRDSVYYRVFDYQYPDLSLLPTFDDPYQSLVDENGLMDDGNGNQWYADGVDGRLVNKSFPRNQRDPSIAQFSDSHFAIAWHSNHELNNAAKYHVYYSIYDISDLETPIIHERNVTVESGLYTNLFPNVQALEDDSFLIVWRENEWDNGSDRNVLATTIRGKVVRFDTNTNGLAESQIFNISDQSHAPEDYDYESTLISVSAYEASTNRIGILWVGEDYESIHGQFYTYGAQPQADGGAPVVTAFNGNFTLSTANAENFDKFRDPKIIALDSNNYFVSFGAGNTLDAQGGTVSQNIYAQTINSSNERQMPETGSNVIINTNSNTSYANSVQSDVTRLDGGAVVGCYAFYDDNDSHPISKTADIGCSVLSDDLSIQAEFKANVGRVHPDFKQSNPEVTPLGDNAFAVFWESLDANEDVTQSESDQPSSDDDLYYRIFMALPDDDDDGVANEYDAFPADPFEQSDSDGDGVGDNADYYPGDASRWAMPVTTLPLFSLGILVSLLGVFGLRKLRS